MNTIKTLLSLVLIGAVAIIGFAYSGVYNIAADEPHWPLTEMFIGTLRDRSIEAHSHDVVVPDLDDPKRIAEGAEHYSAMCAGCHLAPGIQSTEIRSGLYPQPHDFTAHAHSEPKRQFWIIKHGIKMSGMPAWGKTHDDGSIWGLVAFVKKLPGMSKEDYEKLASSGNGHDHGHGSEHVDNAHGDSAKEANHHAEDAGPAPSPAGHVDPPGAPPHSH